MAQEKFSLTLKKFEGTIANTDLLASIDGLKKCLRKKTCNILAWNDGSDIAIPIDVSVDLPPLGNFQGIDIRAVEPIILVINIENYPSIAPKVFTDRLDFPKDQLAHLYVARKGKPPRFCLVRENFDEWYSNKQIKDLIIRTSNWLRDAAAGELSHDGNQFDPVRLEGYYGTAIYDYDQLATLINENKPYNKEGNFAIGLFERKYIDEKFSFKLFKIITPEIVNESYEDFKKENKKDDSSSAKKFYHFGYIVWSKEIDTFTNYSIDLPEDWEGFKIFCQEYGIETDELEKQISEYDLNTFLFIPVIVAIKRPKPIIGFSGNFEFINFALKVDTIDVKEGRIVNNVPVIFQTHHQPLSIRKAKEISGFNADLGSLSLIAGCGALGSKIIIHLARSGSKDYILSDTDTVSPHNLVRHSLLANSEGVNKAAALRKEIAAIFPYEKLQALFSTSKLAESMLTPELIKLYSWVFDFTATHVFMQKLVKTELELSTRVCKAYLTNFGDFGILLFEGENRNPRLDDLQVMLYAQYKEKNVITDWLKREQENQFNISSITVGVGCNSETTILSDDIVSLHGAFFSGVIKSESHKKPTLGKIYLNQIKQEPFFSNTQDLLEIHPLSVLNAVNDHSWQIRIKDGIIEELKREMGYEMPNETGGVFVGRVNHKTKTIHVVELIKAPPDSKSNHACFFRGTEGLPDTIRKINELTGNQLGYIGEWHTHPFGPNTMSATDRETVGRFKCNFESTHSSLPVFLMIITPTHILPYVF